MAIGVAALKIARCLRQSGRDSEVDKRDVERARAVGAKSAESDHCSYQVPDGTQLPLCTINARKITIDSPVGPSESLASAEDPSASPSASACTTNPSVSGYARFLLSRSEVSYAGGADVAERGGSGGKPSDCSNSPNSTSNTTFPLAPADTGRGGADSEVGRTEWVDA